MPGQQITDNSETLFSFELLVENIRIEKHCKVSDELALGVRLLDFPTLLIYQPRQSSASINYQPEQNGGDKRGEYAFHRGKSCFFKMNLMSLHVQLCNTPLYAMVLDVKEETPRLVGSCLISLAKVMDRIRQDVTERGVSTPSSHRERGIVGICNLTGDKIGSISLSYKLLCLGASLLPHITERTGLKSTSGGLQERVKEKNKSTESLPLECGHMCSLIQDRPELSGDIQNNGLANAKILLNENKQDEDAERRPTSQNENHFEEDLTVFCPPHLYYSNSAEEKSKAEEVDYKLLNIDSEAFTLQDSCSEDEEDEKEARGSVMHLKARHNAKVSSNQETSGVTPNVLGEAVRQLPLLNALLVELSQLNGQIPQQSLTVHPSLAWIYKPASTEPSAGHGNTPQNAQTKSLQKARQDSGSEGVQRRAAVLPVPVKASSSPQRAMRGTHIIRPRTHTLSLSSSEGDRGGSASLQTSCSRKLTAASSRVEWSSGGESFISSRGQRAESTKNSDTVRGFSVESRCSFEPQEVGELEDELGSLDFRKEYQHISQLVASKLPGYTM
ncbi:microtubule-associated protein 10 [Stegastes partitus]|uniref:Microtubule-associated protein 10 n=1 Tax=Stegastes partitus TaxID=144197 RepID=A0A9Y4U0Y7_9TELE|nr:PREDICTED: microtubule-associated protein 10 [Stegastes partitus]